MIPVFFLTLREGLEAALLIGIILAYLERTGRVEFRRTVWGGALSASLACAVVGGAIFSFFGGYDPSIPAEDIAALEAALDAAGATYTSEVHRGAAHGFTMADTPSHHLSLIHI